jgi:hypothetical protein
LQDAGPVPFLSFLCLLVVAGPVEIVDKTEHVFRSVLSKQLWKSSAAFCFSISCGNFHRPPRFFLFGSFSFFVEKMSFHEALYAAFGDRVDR